MSILVHATARQFLTVWLIRRGWRAKARSRAVVYAALLAPAGSADLDVQRLKSMAWCVSGRRDDTGEPARSRYS
ncbi:hypothetical protein ACIPC1_07740 [Streptomyces sp. NPDC087263]|uniref:hypothetical protein n=1 Tax=Streptomyces sp. NPDC087263 TaxID=3365773 RepID=UPI0038135900